MTKPKKDQLESENYEAMLTEVESISQKLESEEIGLDEMVSKVERGFQLIRSMKTRLDHTKEKLEELKTEFLGDESTESN